MSYGCITGWVVALTCYISHNPKQEKMVDIEFSGSQNPWTNFDKTWHGWHPGPLPTWQLWWG